MNIHKLSSAPARLACVLRTSGILTFIPNMTPQALKTDVIVGDITNRSRHDFTENYIALPNWNNFENELFREAF